MGTTIGIPLLDDNLFQALGLIFAVIFQFQLTAQSKLLTVEDASWRNYNLFPAYVQNLQWLGNTDNYVYVEKNNLYKHDAKKGKTNVLFTLNKLNTAFVKAGNDSLKRMPRFTFDNSFAVFSKKENYFKYY